MTPSRDFLSASSPMMTPSKPASVIGADLAIVGQKITLVCQSALVISGEVAGDIHGDDVTVGETGKVTGTVSARNLSVHGEVHGQLRGETVALYATARISGDIIQKNLVIAEGAQFDGRVRSAKDQSDWQPVLDANAHRDASA
jgi:cytoskeletal protein CcmA (bactofilin family)